MQFSALTFSIIPKALKMLPCIAQKKLILARHELQEVVALLWRLITQVGFILTSKADHLFDAFGITTSATPFFEV